MLSLTSNYNSIQQETTIQLIEQDMHTVVAMIIHFDWVRPPGESWLPRRFGWFSHHTSPAVAFRGCISIPPRCRRPLVPTPMFDNLRFWVIFLVGCKGPFLALQLTWVAKNSGHPTAIQEVRVSWSIPSFLDLIPKKIIEGKFGCSRVVCRKQMDGDYSHLNGS